MANTIKGLTVEIGGDTTKLGKALENVNKKSRELSSELGSINKLLKMDPGNADLLAQKQKVLADAVSNTREKLDKLKEAEKQVQAQFERGEVSEAQVRELQREIIATTKKLDSYENAARETAEALEKLGDSSGDVTDGAKKTKKGADDASDSLDDLADSADKAGGASDGLGSKLGSVAKGGLAAVAAAAAAAIGALIGSAEATREYRTEMGKLDTAFTTNGHNSEAALQTYKSLQGVLGETDQAVEAANHLAKLTDNEKDLETWTHTLTGVYATFGASLPIEGLTEAANETAKVGQVTGPLADALNWAGVSEDKFNESLAACSTEQERQTLIMETLNGLYGEAADKYKETNAEVIRANEANEAWMSSMAEIGAVIEPILTDIKLLGASLLSDLVPGVKAVAEAFRGILNGDEGAADALGDALSGIITQLLTKVTELAPTLVDVAMSLITTLVTSLINMLPTLLTTVLDIIIQVINALAVALPQIVEAVVAIIPQLITRLIEAVPQLLQAAITLLMAIVDALPVIIVNLIEALPSLIKTIMDALLEAIPMLLDAAINLLMAILDALPVIIAALVDALPSIINTIIDALLVAIPQIIDAAITLLMAILDALPVIIDALVEALPVIINTIIDALLEALPVLLEAAITLLMAIIDAIPTIIDLLIIEIPRIVTTIIRALVQRLPDLIKGAVQLLMGIVKAIPQIITQLVAKVPEIAKTILKSLSEGLKNIGSIGKDLIKGLWNGINDMVGWIGKKIKGFGESVLGGLKSFFGIKSPSRVFRDQIGKNLALGMAEGIEDNADAPLDAMADLSNGVLDQAENLNGLTLERRLNTTFGGADAAEQAQNGLLVKLDNILKAIENGQILTIDGETLIGATVDKIDKKLGQRRALAARGAL